ncbi:MAG: nucleoside phosphorylase [SAR324 cluster bacterium]|nr:nucleoside phosphorylase [SAR324 cluster bacterium]
MSHYQSAQKLKDKTGRQYHLAVAPQEVAPYILLCGDPARAEKTAQFFDKIHYEKRHREYVTYTGVYNESPISVVATGIGCDNTEIAIVELSQCVAKPTFLRIGTCGALQPNIKLGDIIISTAAMRFENTSSWFAPIEYPAVAHYQIIQMALTSAISMGIKHHEGITATCSGFYGAQERTAGGYEPWQTGLIDKLSKLGVVNMEMEASTLFVLAGIKSFRAGAICTAYANRKKDIFIDPSEADKAEQNLIKLGLRIMHSLQVSDMRFG